LSLEGERKQKHSKTTKANLSDREKKKVGFENRGKNGGWIWGEKKGKVTPVKKEPFIKRGKLPVQKKKRIHRGRETIKGKKRGENCRSIRKGGYQTDLGERGNQGLISTKKKTEEKDGRRHMTVHGLPKLKRAGMLRAKRRQHQLWEKRRVGGGDKKQGA